MTLEEAIEIYTSNAEYERTHGSLQGCMDFKQLAEWLKELKAYKEQGEDYISRNAAIVQLSHNKIGDNDCDVIIQKDIETIKALAPVTPWPCDDAISRQAAIDAIYARYIGGKEAVDKAPASDHYAEGIDEAVCAVENLPPVTPQQKIGHWCDEFGGCECSECGCLEAGHSDYCPNCGAKMAESEEKE